MPSSTSVRGVIVTINNLVADLTKEDVFQFEKILQEKLNKNNRRELLQLLLFLSENLLAIDDINDIYNQVVSIWNNRKSFRRNKLPSISKDSKPSNNDMYNNNYLCKLSSNTVNAMSKYLSKQQSITLGYCNRFSYSQTQKKTYILNRCNDPPFRLSSLEFNISILSVLSIDDHWTIP